MYDDAIGYPNRMHGVSGGTVIIIHWGVQHPKRLTVVNSGAKSSLPHAPKAYATVEIAVPADGPILLIDLEVGHGGGRWSTYDRKFGLIRGAD